MGSRWVTLALVFLQNVVLYLHTCTGSLECVCTTPECHLEQRPTCEAGHVCYVQYMSPVSAQEEVVVVRGCIDDRTPLLCENRRPQAYTGSWPVLHCCRENFCNKDIMPTDPTWLVADNENPIKEAKPNRNMLPDLSAHDPETEPMDDPTVHARDRHMTSENAGSSQFQQTRSNRNKAINPLYIGVPVAGACVLLAIIIFAIYVLKRQNQYLEEYRYHSSLRPPPCPHKPGINDLEVHQVSSKNTFYAECERSSSGSETKLLMKV